MEKYRNTLLISVNDIKQNTLISNNVDDKYISNTINTAQEIYLSRIIGTALYHRLQQLVYNEITKTSPKIMDYEFKIYREMLEELIRPLLKYRTSIDLLYNVSWKIRNAGVVRNSDTNVSYAQLEEIKYLEKQFLTFYNTYCDRLSKYLKAHTNSLGEILENTPCYYDKAIINHDFANDGGLWLGGKHSNKNKCDC